MSNRQERRRRKRLKRLPEYQLAEGIAPAMEWLIAEGKIPADGVIAADDIAGQAAHYDRLQAKGYWRSPQINAPCAQCGKTFVLRFWLEHKPSPDNLEKLDVRDSEGGMIMHDPVVHVTPLGLAWNWITLCDDCSPI